MNDCRIALLIIISTDVMWIESIIDTKQLCGALAPNLAMVQQQEGRGDYLVDLKKQDTAAPGRLL